MAEDFLEEDPYQVYTLRRPAERASTIVPQLPKQPEFTDTRLRYRRIARSGSLQDLSYLPRNFHFPPRVSMLDTLSEDESMVKVGDGRVVRAPSAWGGRGKDFVLLVESPGSPWGDKRVSVVVRDKSWLKRFLIKVGLKKGEFMVEPSNK